jgi:hypothetical protein
MWPINHGKNVEGSYALYLAFRSQARFAFWELHYQGRFASGDRRDDFLKPSHLLPTSEHESFWTLFSENFDIF